MINTIFKYDPAAFYCRQRWIGNVFRKEPGPWESEHFYAAIEGFRTELNGRLPTKGQITCCYSKKGCSQQSCVETDQGALAD